MDHQNQIGNNFFEVFKGREEILFRSHLSSSRALLSAGGGVQLREGPVEVRVSGSPRTRALPRHGPVAPA